MAIGRDGNRGLFRPSHMTKYSIKKMSRDAAKGDCMKREILRIPSPADGLELEALAISPDGEPSGIVQISHGMSEHKERYEPFMEFLAQNGLASVIHDHRGHGASVRELSDLGYFYTEKTEALVEDLYAVTKWAKKRWPNVPLTLFSHSMGTLVARCYLKSHDDELDRLILCGPPTENSAVGAAIGMTKVAKAFGGDRRPNNMLNGLALGEANKRFGEPFAWLSTDPAEVEKYRKDPLCGFVFTNNGFLNLFLLMKEAFDPNGWGMRHRDLPILLIAGADDPIIRSEKDFRDLEHFLSLRGYADLSSKLYPAMRHELLNEKDRNTVYLETLLFTQTGKIA